MEKKWLKVQGRVLVAISETSNPLQSEGIGCKTK
jgi:hypothetical protein